MKCSAFERIARWWCDPFALLIVVLAGLGTAHILARTATYGAAVTVDSVTFLSTATNFLAGEGWREVRGHPLVGWPPLFPLLIAALGWVGLDPVEAGRWVNAGAFGWTILAAGGWLRSNLRARWLMLAATGVLVTSLPLSELASHCLTDSLFALLTLLALVQLVSFLHCGGRRPLLLGVVFTALAALTRWPGVLLIGVGVLVLLVRRAPPLAARLKDAGVLGAVSSLPLAIVLTRNWVISGTLTGPRTGTEQSLSDGLNQIVQVFRQWAIPPNAPDGLGYLLWTAAGLVVVAVVVVAGRGLGRSGQEGTDRLASPSFGLGPVLPFGMFALGYLGFMVAIVPFTVVQGIDSRYLLPIYAPLLLVAAFLLDRCLSIEAVGWILAAKWCLAALVLLGVLAHIGFSAQRNLTITEDAVEKGYLNWTYNGRYWKNSEILEYIGNNRINGRIYSSDFYLAWFADRTAAPGKHQRLPDELHEVIPQIRKEGGTGAHIVWFKRQKNYYDYDDTNLWLLPGVEPVAELADGVVFRLTAAEPFQKGRYMELEELVRQAKQAGEQVVRSGWDVYRNGRWLTYLKQPCTPADAQAKFVLHVIPVDLADLPADRRQYGFDNLDFYFNRRGVLLGDQCIALARLPDYAISHVRVGQWIAKENQHIWGAEFSPGR